MLVQNGEFMSANSIPHRYFWIILLAACGQVTPQEAVATQVQSTALAIAQTGIALTQTAMPTSTPEATATPTQPIVPILTPDAIQVEKWKEYQAELAKAVISSDPELTYDPATYESNLCEWDILGQSGQEVYVYAVCISSNGNGEARRAAIIYLKSDGSIQSVMVAGFKGPDYDLELFPANVQNKIYFYSPGSRADVLYAHLEYRKIHTEEPPLVILSATPMP
jgi:hypothetical protein